MIETYSDYIRDYISNTGGLHLPGEHHFVAVYLVPRLHAIPSLGVPDFVNPDGMKAIPGDIVFYDRDTEDGKWKLKLGIEVKIRYLRFSRTEYNMWMTAGAAKNERPQLFIGIARQGMLVGEWDSFASRFKRIAYPNGSEPAILREGVDDDRYTLRKDLVKVALDTQRILPESDRPLPDSLRWYPYSADAVEARDNEAEAVQWLTAFCKRVTSP